MSGVNFSASRRQLCSTDAGQITSDGLGFFVLRSLSHAEPRQRLQAFCRGPCRRPECRRASSARDARENRSRPFDTDAVRPARSSADRRTGTPLKSRTRSRNACASGESTKRVQSFLVQMRDVFQADFLRHGDEAVHAHFGHRLVRALHGGGVEFHPAGIRQLHKPAGRGGEPFEVGLGKFHAFRLPFGGDGEPVNAAALDDQARLEQARREEQTVKRGVAEKFRFRRLRAPTLRRASRENFHSRRRSTSPAPA